MSYMQSSGAKQVARFQDHHQIVLGPDGQAKIDPCETSKDRSTLVDGKVAGAKGPGHKYYKSLATTKTGCWQDEIRTSGPVCASSGGAATAAPPAEEAAGGVIISKDWYQNARVQSKQTMGMAVASIMTAEVADIGLFNKALATNLKGSAEKVILFGLATEPKCVHAVDTWQGILSDYPSFRDVRTVWVGGKNVEASATLGASGIPCGALVRMHFIPDLPHLPGGMTQETEEPLRKEDLQLELPELNHVFSPLATTGGLHSMTFEQSLLHPDISAWISDGSITEQRLGELWNQVVASQDTEVLGVMQFLDFAHAVEEEIGTGSQVRSGSDFFGNYHDAGGSPHDVGESLEEKTDVLPEEKVDERVVAALPVHEQAENVTAKKSNAVPCCSELQKSICLKKEVFKGRFPMVLVPPGIMLLILVLLFAVPKTSEFDEDKCLAPGTDFMMLETLVQTCDCVQPELEDAYLNALTVAAIACVTPVLFKLFQMCRKYRGLLLHGLRAVTYPLRVCIRFVAARIWCGATLVEVAEVKLNEAEEVRMEEMVAQVDAYSERIEATLGVIGSAALLANFVIAVTTLYQYASMAPVGGGVCRAVYTTYVVIYRPFSVSMFSILVANCDQVHWWVVERMAVATRKALKLIHAGQSPFDDNFLFVFLSALAAAMICVWGGAVLVLFPLAIVFFPVIAFMDFALPLVTVYSPLYFMDRFDSFLEARRLTDKQRKMSDGEGFTASSQALTVSDQVGADGLEEKADGNVVGDKTEKDDDQPETDPTVKADPDVQDIDTSVPQAFILKAIAAAVICSVAIVASFATFYTQGGWVEATKALTQALASLTIELSFKLDVTFRWPFSLPNFAQILYCISLGTLVIQKLLENWSHVYHRYVKTLGGELVEESRKQITKKDPKVLDQVIDCTDAVFLTILAPSRFIDYQVQKALLTANLAKSEKAVDEYRKSMGLLSTGDLELGKSSKRKDEKAELNLALLIASLQHSSFFPSEPLRSREIDLTREAERESIATISCAKEKHEVKQTSTKEILSKLVESTCPRLKEIVLGQADHTCNDFSLAQVADLAVAIPTRWSTFEQFCNDWYSGP